MNPRYWGAFLLLTLVTGVLVWPAPPGTNPAGAHPAPATGQAGFPRIDSPTSARQSHNADRNADWFAPPGQDPAAQAPHPAPPSFDTAAINSLRANRDHDPRAPVTGAPENPYQSPDTATLSDSDRYRDWQLGHREARYSAYLEASNQKLRDMERQLAWGRENGVSASDLAAGEEKRARLAQVRANLAKDYPHLAEAIEQAGPSDESHAWQPPTTATR